MSSTPMPLPMPPRVDDLEDDEVPMEEQQRQYHKRLKAWKKQQPYMTFRLRPGAGHHINMDPDGQERMYKAVEGRAILSRLNLAEAWPEKFERIDGYATEQNPYLSVPAPGELPEEFQNRMKRLKAQGAVDSAVAEAAKAGFASVLSGSDHSPQFQASAQSSPGAAAPLPAVNQRPSSPSPQEFEKMTVAQLKKWAEDNEITLSPNISDKNKIIGEIRRGMDVK